MKQRILLALLVAAGLSGCGTVGGWFGLSGAKTTEAKPAALAPIMATANLTRMWDANVGKGLPYVFSPVTDGQAVYAAGTEGHLVKLDLASGRELWRIDAGRFLSAGVGVGDGLALVGTAKGEVLAYRTENGQLAWSAKLSGEILAPPVAANGAVAVRGNDGNVWLLDAKDGKRRWVYNRVIPSLTLRVPGNLLLTERALFVGYPGGTLAALALNNGAPLWETSVAIAKGANELERIADVTGPLAADDQVVCAAAYQGRIGCFDQTNGNPIWVRNFSGLSGAGIGGRYLYAADEHATVQGYDLTSGANPWKQDALRDRRLSTPLAVAKYVAVADYQGDIHLLGEENGALVGRTASDGGAVNGQMLALKSGLIVQTAKGGVYAFKIQ
ncbi:MAG: outer membrane protein assembly factor BamB [Hydrogenophilales bacterium CG03_land_8_20_14_0_80_62_28]|nr:outer membrane protein assembly factor BamB [Betaproteobacteria bacterium]OIO79998.1 MAG: outer membrane protein assembly factor BamB [Hydrogenophilaceae bacterium CG1_02_62_390]PIV22791.1 MAG: outer membrane protein assembly factor BamB [Hydrogenophilales bacterium CG03_land_8_20_14_0_80_62_28]PIW39470.1 MAG: outer membrane protein assembly factor BamB [Hydrogenophilales bacterium CG15_BIG_FIL_POST_REV_8_21_14_020_62_31]PIW72684.1 MAG: outer membrane protein assembly factor BamB [Hydrogenop